MRVGLGRIVALCDRSSASYRVATVSGASVSETTMRPNPRYAAKWLGDNAAEFDDMKMSIPGILTASIFGFSMIGADICGFGAPSDPDPALMQELCTRWMQVGAWYPFARNHNAWHNPGHAPFELGKAVKRQGSVQPAVRSIPDSLTYSVPRFLKRQCDRPLGEAREQARARRADGARPLLLQPLPAGGHPGELARPAFEVSAAGPSRRGAPLRLIK